MGQKCGIHTQWSFAIKNNKIMLFAGKWMELEIIMLNKTNKPVPQRQVPQVLSHDRRS
jgi:hypothetical protein